MSHLRAPALFVVACALGCGSGGGDALSNKSLSELSDNEKATICEEENMKSGGYGQTMQCPDGLLTTSDANLNACLARFPSSPNCSTFTVADLRKCDDDFRADPCGPVTLDCYSIFFTCFET